MSRLKSKVAFITGASRGIGRAVAQAYVREGARVALVATRKANVQRMCDELSLPADQVLCLGADVSKREQVQQAVQDTLAHWGEIDVLINNAGIYHAASFLDHQAQDFQRLLDVNVFGVIHCMQACLPQMQARRRGAIINIASTAGLRPRPGLTVYNSSKGAVILLSKSMAAEFGPDNVRVNCVNPVFSPDTALSADFAGGAVTEEARKAFLSTIPLGRFSTPLDVANACLYLASDEAAMISGSCIEVDGARCV